MQSHSEKNNLERSMTTNIDTKNEITNVRLKDNNVVTMGSNFDNIKPLVRKQKVEVDVLSL